MNIHSSSYKRRCKVIKGRRISAVKKKGIIWWIFFRFD